MALNAPRYAAVEALRGDMGWSTFREKHMKATLKYKVRLERMEWNVKSSRWEKKCMNMVDRSGMLIKWVHRFSEGRESV